MKTKLFILFLFVGVTLPVFGQQQVSIKDVLAAPEKYDAQDIFVVGEVLDVLVQRGGVWVNILSEGASIGVWAEESSMVPAVTRVVSYYERGDTVGVRGVFHSGCVRHLGQMDIHAQEITLLEQGKKIIRHIPFWKRQAVMVGSGIFLLVFLAYKITTGKAGRYGRKT